MSLLLVFDIFNFTVLNFFLISECSLVLLCVLFSFRRIRNELPGTSLILNYGGHANS